MLPQRISSIQAKVRQIHAQLQPTNVDPELGGIGSSGPFNGLARKFIGSKQSLCCCLRKQLFFAQCLKLLALFSVAIVHLLYLHPFLELFTQLEEYVEQFDLTVAPSIKNCLHDLANYKKNIWMAVAVLCAALSTSSFFLFFLPSASPIRKSYVYLVGFIDAISFGCLPFFFYTRASIVQRVQQRISHVLREAHKIVSAEKLMNDAQCSIQPREKLPFCSDLILRSIFPVDLLKFLLVLCVMTLAYLLVAYIIYWCIKHWIPHSANSQRKFCYCCSQRQNSSPLKKAFVSYAPLRQSDKFLAPLVVPNPLMSVPSPSSQCSPAQSEEIPVEPTPKSDEEN